MVEVCIEGILLEWHWRSNGNIGVNSLRYVSLGACIALVRWHLATGIALNTSLKLYCNTQQQMCNFWTSFITKV